MTLPGTGGSSPLVQIEVNGVSADKTTAVSSSAPSGEAPSWARLTPQEQAIHLKAQRTAKVRVAQMRISEPDALRQGLRGGDIYGALQSSIDVAREEFQRSYVSASPTMVDYLHLELLRSLAHDDGGLLGQGYPGPLV